MKDNKFNEKTGMIEGGHLDHLAKTGIHSLIERSNNFIGMSRPLTDADLPAKVRSLVEQSVKLADQLRKCEGLPVAMAAEYVWAQAKLSGEALPLMQAELDRRRQAARDAVAHLRQNLIGKGGNSLVLAGGDALLHSLDVQGTVEREAGLAAWGNAFAIIRDNATGKTIPRWLAVLIQAHEVEKMKANG